MKSVRTEGCHVVLFREFVGTACRTYGQSNTTNPTLINVTLVSNPRRYIGNLNASFGLSDHHNIMWPTRPLGDLHQNNSRGKIFYRSYKHFNECDFTHDIAMASWWRHQMETFSALLAICAGNSPVPVNSPHKGQWRGALMFSLICARINDWVNNREAGDLRRYRGHYDVIVMSFHVAYIFDDVDDTAWFHASLIKCMIDSHAPVKTKIIRKESVPFMNSKLRKVQYKRNKE